MTERRLFLDADGVLADFDEGARKLLGMSPKDFIAKHGRSAFWKRLAKARNFYGSLREMPDARELFDRLLELRNDVGLLSEEYDPRTCRLVGNFPQAFTHVALVSSAFNLTRFEKPAEQRARPATEDLSIAADV